MNRKRFLAALMAVLLLVSAAAPAMAANYPDLQGHWSKAYMEDLAARGYLTGYTDGTMGPEKEITGAEAIAMLSRMYALSAEELDRLYEDFDTSAQEAVPASMSWLYKNAAVCLAAGIVTAEELKGMQLSVAIKKEFLAVLFVRAMQITENLPYAAPTFADTADIAAAYRPYVRLLADLGVVTGDEKNNFSPRLSVTRAVSAAMFSRALDHMEAQNSLPVLDGYMGVNQVEGVINELKSGSFTMTGLDGLQRVYVTTSNAKITVNGELGTGFSYVGHRATAYVDGKTGEVKEIEVQNDSAVWVQASLIRVSTTSLTKTVYITNTTTGTAASYTLNSAVKVYANGTTTTPAELVAGSFVTLKLEGDKVTELYAYSGDSEIAATVKGITFDAVSKLVVESADHTSYCFYLNISSQPKVLRNGVEISLDRIRVGDQLTVTSKKCVVTTLTIQGQTAGVSGELTMISTTATGTSLTIRADDGSMATYPLDSDAVFWSGETEIRQSDVKIGDEVTLVIFSGYISDLYLKKTVISSEKVSGTVLTLDTSKMQLIILSEGSLVYVNATSATPILDTAKGTSLRFSSIPLDSNITAYGAYTTSNQFAAKSIIIE